MPALTSSDVSVTILRRAVSGARKHNRCSITFGDGALTYPTNGVPLPGKGSFGLAVEIDDLAILRDNLDGYVRKYDPTNHTIRIYQTATLTPGVFSIQNALGAAADVAGSMTADQAAAPTNGDRIDTLAAVAAGAWAYTENNEIDVPRNVCITLYNDSGGGINMEEAAFTATITGTFRGAAQTDVVTETFTAGNKAIANTKYRWKYGVKPFEKITSVVITGLTANQNNLKIGVGLGRLLGVPFNTQNGLAADFLKVVKNSSNHAVVAYNDTNKTLDLGAIADNDDFDITVLGTMTSERAEVGTGHAPAAQTLYVDAIGA